MNHAVFRHCPATALRPPGASGRLARQRRHQRMSNGGDWPTRRPFERLDLHGLQWHVVLDGVVPGPDDRCSPGAGYPDRRSTLAAWLDGSITSRCRRW